MAGKLLGSVIDIHGGGEDLRFPHHDNEMAQSEAYYDNHQWINYFLHSGHLHIDGLKMSKSLKNFITIRDLLSNFSGTQIRMLFLLQSWDRVMNYNQKDPMNEVDSWIKKLQNFFRKVNNVEYSRRGKDVNEAWGESEIALNNLLSVTQRNVHDR
jgi:cysteinyl-tRNA synthetase